MTDHDTRELHRIVADDPTHSGMPDLPALVEAGRRRLVRGRSMVAGAALGAAAAVVVPTLLLAGGPGDSARDAGLGDVAGGPSTSAGTTADGRDCGELSCIDPARDTVETGTLVGEPLVVGPLPGGGEELVYVINTEGVDLGSNEKGRVDVLKAGYRLDGELHSTVWALQPGYDGDSPPRFWSNPGLLGAPNGTGDRYVVVGYVDGTPEEITWSSPDGRSGAVDGMQAMDDYTIFYLTRPLPDDYEPPRYKRNKDGSVIIDGGDGQRGDGPTSIEDLTTDGSTFPPELTIHTSDGWSCSLAECGSMG